MNELEETNSIKTISYKSVNTPYNKDCEKNWVFYGDHNIIYQWYPLITGKIMDDKNNTNNNDLYPPEKLADDVTIVKSFE